MRTSKMASLSSNLSFFQFFLFLIPPTCSPLPSCRPAPSQEKLTNSDFVPPSCSHNRKNVRQLGSVRIRRAKTPRRLTTNIVSFSLELLLAILYHFDLQEPMGHRIQKWMRPGEKASNEPKLWVVWGRRGRGGEGIFRKPRMSYSDYCKRGK